MLTMRNAMLVAETSDLRQMSLQNTGNDLRLARAGAFEL
jgi:hypothetical protein